MSRQQKRGHGAITRIRSCKLKTVLQNTLLVSKKFKLATKYSSFYLQNKRSMKQEIYKFHTFDFIITTILFNKNSIYFAKFCRKFR